MLPILIYPALLLPYSCAKDGIKPYNLPYFYIKNENLTDVEISSGRKDTIAYKICLNAQHQKEPIDLQYEIKAGNGLREGHDFKLITTGNTLTFPQGVFECPIRIAWLAAATDPSKDNSITIRLVSNSKDFIMGLPGPDQIRRQLVITKK